MRSSCVRCGTAAAPHPPPIRSTVTWRSPAPRWCCSSSLWLGHADEGLDRRHRARDHAGSRARSSWSTAACGRWRWRSPSPPALAPLDQVRRHALRAGRPQDAAAAAQPARRLPAGAPRWAPGRCSKCCCSACSWPTPSSATWCTIELGPAVYALGLLTIVIVWAEVALDPHAVWEEIERRGQTHAPMPARAPLDLRPGAVGCEGCGLVVRARRGRRPGARAAARRVHERKPDSLVAHLGLRDRRRHPLHPGQRLSGADRHPARRRRAQHHPGRRRGAAAPRGCIRWRCWCSSPASWCRCSS